MDHPNFQPQIYSMLAVNRNIAFKADEMDEVGVINIRNTSGKNGPSAVVGWSFIFPLEGFRNPVQQVHVAAIRRDNELFGRVVRRQMLEPITKLSKIPNCKRDKMKLKLEFIP